MKNRWDLLRKISCWVEINILPDQKLTHECQKTLSKVLLQVSYIKYSSMWTEYFVAMTWSFNKYLENKAVYCVNLEQICTDAIESNVNRPMTQKDQYLFFSWTHWRKFQPVTWREPEFGSPRWFLLSAARCCWLSWAHRVFHKHAELAILQHIDIRGFTTCSTNDSGYHLISIEQ